VAGRNSSTLHPGTVDVAVLPPVNTADWTAENLRERIEEIRASYVDLLSDWPVTGLDGADSRQEPDGQEPGGPGADGQGPDGGSGAAA
jgi:putative phosphoserine phosphatase / 1-acylglycerol-3-phosphate O-acyltransferase